MIICKLCGKETPTAIKSEFLCFKCYDKVKRQVKPIEVRAKLPGD